MKLNPSFIYKYIRLIDDVNAERYGLVCDIYLEEENGEPILQLSYGSSIYEYKEHEISNIEIIDERYIKEFDEVILKDGTRATVVDFMGTSLIVDVGEGPANWETLSVIRSDVVEVIKK